MVKKEKILFVLILSFLVTLFLPWIKLLNIFSAIFLGLFAFFYDYTGNFSEFWKEKWKVIRERKHLQWMFLFMIIVGISILLSSNFKKGVRYLDPRLPLLYFPVSIGLLQLKKGFKEKILLAFAWLTCLMVLLCLVWGLYRSEFFKRPEFLYNDSLTEILGQQSIYISLLVNISIYIFTYHIIYKKNNRSGWMILATLFLFVMSYLLASRNLMIILYAFTLGFALYYILNKKKYLEGLALIMGLFLGIFMVFKFFPKTFNRFRELAYTQFNFQSMGRESHYNMEVTQDQWNGVNFRMAVWQCGWELFLAHPLKGVDIGDKNDALVEKFREKNFQFALQTKKNVHSNYLDILYSMGLIGLGIFLTAWVLLPLIYAYKHKDGLSILILLTFISAWVTEIYFDRSLGGMLSGFFIPFLLTDRIKEN